MKKGGVIIERVKISMRVRLVLWDGMSLFLEIIGGSFQMLWGIILLLGDTWGPKKAFKSNSFSILILLQILLF